MASAELARWKRKLDAVEKNNQLISSEIDKHNDELKRLRFHTLVLLQHVVDSEFGEVNDVSAVEASDAEKLPIIANKKTAAKYQATFHWEHVFTPQELSTAATTITLEPRTAIIKTLPNFACLLVQTINDAIFAIRGRDILRDKAHKYVRQVSLADAEKARAYLTTTSGYFTLKAERKEHLRALIGGIEGGVLPALGLCGHCLSMTCLEGEEGTQTIECPTPCVCVKQEMV
eukprot:TRINITY_DN5464_c0_g1_i1.p1 TRINITY_DN5464_c0_g1~~TRINITY_DN5464_c0_g1_i1.p1  ORF type:complete len:231 (-),score=21.48 TRINITY_DN5464_c0_g1_i1:747-1439(-)